MISSYFNLNFLFLQAPSCDQEVIHMKLKEPSTERNL